jgi:hypothetical protein
MALPIGTTARQLRTLARWLLAGLVLLGVSTWWWPGYRAWGALSAGLVLVLTLWLLWRIVAADRTVPGHSVQMAWLVPAVVALYHLLRVQPGGAVAGEGLSGAMTVTLLLQLALLAAGVMLAQSLLPKVTDRPPVVLPALCSLALCGGAFAASAWTPAGLPRQPAALLACAAGLGAAGAVMPSVRAAGSRWVRRAATVGCTAAVVGVCAIAARLSETAVEVAALLLAGSVLVALGRGRWLRVGAVIAAAVAFAALLACLAARTAGGPDVPLLWLGRGEAALTDATVARGGLELLTEALGVPAVGALLVGLAAAAAWLISQREPAWGGWVRASCWTTAAGLSVAALLSEGGLFLPAVTLAVAVLWGLLPAMCGAAARRSNGLWLLGVLVALMVVLGLSRRSGMVGWASMALGGSDRTLHLVSGFLLAMVLAWLLGARRVKLGLLGILLSVLAGAAAEVLQSMLTGRGMPPSGWLAVLAGSASPAMQRGTMDQLDDFVLHAVGAVVVVVPYLLAVGSRWCESAEAGMPPARG